MQDLHRLQATQNEHRISAAATDGDNGMRFLSPTYWTLAQPNSPLRRVSRIRPRAGPRRGAHNDKPTPYETDRQYLDVVVLCVEIQRDAEHERRRPGSNGRSTRSRCFICPAIPAVLNCALV